MCRRNSSRKPNAKHTLAFKIPALILQKIIQSPDTFEMYCGKIIQKFSFKLKYFGALNLVALALFSTVAWADVEFEGILIPEEEGHFGDSAFIYPNEQANHVYAPILVEKNGALVSVGTFRTLNTAVLGNFTHLFQLDADAGTVAFNRMNNALIAHAKSRKEYLSFLSGNEWIEPGVLGKKLPNEYWKSFPQPLQDDFLRLHKHLGDKNFFHSHRWDPHTIAASYNMKVGASSLKNTIFGSDEAFQKVQAMIRDGRVFAINASISGPNSIKGLANALRKKNIQVSAVDVSNILFYLKVDEGQKFLANLDLLPMEKDGLFLFTSEIAPAKLPRADGNWAFMAMLKSETAGFQEQLRSLENESIIEITERIFVRYLQENNFQTTKAGLIFSPEIKRKSAPQLECDRSFELLFSQ